MPDFQLLGSLMNDLHQEFVGMFYLLLPVFFSLAVVLAWFRSPAGSPEFLDIVKRAVVATVLLVSFPDISKAILHIADAIAFRIDELNGIEAVLRMAEEKSQSYDYSATSLLLRFDDLIIGILSIGSYILLYIARYLTIAMYHFFWLFFMVSSPLLILFHMFEGTQQITRNLFVGMIEVASWKIVWAILGSMLTALSFGDAYKAEGSYLTLVVMNFVIAAAMLMTPMMVKSLSSGGAQGMSAKIGTAAVGLLAAGHTKMLKPMAGLEKTSRTAIGNAGSSMVNRVAEFRQSRIERKKPYLAMTKRKDDDA
jgi:hypothetical protein